MLLLFLGIVNSCRNDYLQEQQAKNDANISKLTSKIISLNQSKHKEKLWNELKESKTLLNKSFKNQSIFSKNVSFGDSIIINTDKVIYIENGPNYHTYTFVIERPNALSSNPVENLLLSPLPDGSYQEFLVTYQLSEQEKLQLLNGHPVDLEGKTMIVELSQGTFNGSGQFAKTTMVCGWSNSIHWALCSEGIHGESNYGSCQFIGDFVDNAGNPGFPPYPYLISSYNCEEVDETLMPNDPPPGGGNGGGGDGGDSGTGNPPSDDCSGVASNPGEVGIVDGNGCNVGVVTQPNIDNGRNSPCADLKNKSVDNSDFLNKMQELKTDAGGLHEAARVMYRSNPKYGDKVFGNVDASTQNSYLNLPYDPLRAPDITGFMHCHLNILNIPMLRTLTVFSMSDFVALAQLVENSTAPVNQLGMYVTTERGTFAIKLTSKQAIIDFANYIIANQEEVLKKYEKKIKWNMSKKQQTEGLLNLIKDSGFDGMGIELYESDSDFKNWKKHYLDENNKPQSIKCN